MLEIWSFQFNFVLKVKPRCLCCSTSSIILFWKCTGGCVTFLFENVIDLVFFGLKFTSHWSAHSLTFSRLLFRTVGLLCKLYTKTFHTFLCACEENAGLVHTCPKFSHTTFSICITRVSKCFYFCTIEYKNTHVYVCRITVSNPL